MIVAGGYYREVCLAPDQDNRFGSGGRAALALAMGGVPVDWHYYCPVDTQETTAISLSKTGLTHHPHETSETIEFTYFHPLSEPTYSPAQLPQSPRIELEGDSILRFGFMEGDAVVRGKSVVFDPQNSNAPRAFGENGSSADRLAVVLNSTEVLKLGDAADEVSAVKNITAKQGASVVLVKSGVKGCRVYEDGKGPVPVPAYRTERVYKIG